MVGLCCLHPVRLVAKMANTIKTLVSKKKQRYVEDGYNLDLSYINERVIAMGFPAENLEALYRNSMDEVKKFLDDKHANHYMIYNLCSEKIYDKSKFHGRVKHYPFDDHHPPDFSLIGPFCEDVHAWLSQDNRNVAAVHCKAGKGRTGVMICCYLLYSGHCGGLSTDAQGVLDFYGQKRTMDEKGVTIPSQRRYIHYYDRLLRRSLVYNSVKLYLRCIVLDPVPTFKNIANDCLLSFVVSQRRRAMPYESRWYVMKRVDRQVRLEVDPPLLISDDVKIEFMTKPRLDFVGLNSKMWRKSSKEFHFWLNTFFVDAEINGGLAHDILMNDHPASSAVSTVAYNMSEPPTAWAGVDSNPEYNPFFNVSLPNQHHLRNLEAQTNDVTRFKYAGDTNQDEKAPTIFSELGRRLSEQGVIESPMITLESEADIRQTLLPPHHQTVVSMASLMDGANVTSISELMKHYSLHEELEQNSDNNRTKNGQINQNVGPHVTLTSNNSNASSSSSSSVSLTATSGGNGNGNCNAPSPLSVPTTNSSFIEKRTRHASVPQTSSSPGAMSHLIPHPGSGGKKQGHNSAQKMGSPAVAVRPISIEGGNIALRLNKSQIDKAAKDKQCKVFGEKFNVTLFFTKPTDQSDDLVDYSLQDYVCPTGDNFHHITVTPVTLSSSNTNIATTNYSSTETQKNPVKSETQKNPVKTDQQKKGGKNTSKGLKKSEHKSRMSLMHFSRKAESSSDEEQECGAACAPSTAPAPVAFAPAPDRNSEEERLSFRDPLPSAFPQQQRGEKSKNQKEEKRRNHHAPVASSQSDWI